MFPVQYIFVGGPSAEGAKKKEIKKAWSQRSSRSSSSGSRLWIPGISPREERSPEIERNDSIRWYFNYCDDIIWHH